MGCPLGVWWMELFLDAYREWINAQVQEQRLWAFRDQIAGGSGHLDSAARLHDGRPGSPVEYNIPKRSGCFRVLEKYINQVIKDHRRRRIVHVIGGVISGITEC